MTSLDKLIEEAKKKMVGKRFGRLVVKKYYTSRNKESRLWLCHCDCGKSLKVTTNSLNTKHTRSCGCLRTDELNERTRTHGLSKTVFYSRWLDIRKRIFNKKRMEYKYYGGRGIKLCKRWFIFEKFAQDMLPSFKEHCKKYGALDTQIERINVNGDYKPSNCKWIRAADQALNKTNSVRIKFNGVKKSIGEWSHKTGLPPRIIRDRLRIGWPIPRALSEPIHKS